MVLRVYTRYTVTRTIIAPLACAVYNRPRCQCLALSRRFDRALQSTKLVLVRGTEIEREREGKEDIYVYIERERGYWRRAVLGNE